MPPFRSAVLLLALGPLVFSSPVARLRKTFTITQGVPQPYDPGPVALAKAYMKYNVEVPPEVQAAVANGSVGAFPETYDTRYLCPVTIGGQMFDMDFDTGSADLSVRKPDESCR